MVTGMLVLPVPPSANRMYVPSVNRQIKTNQYKNWLNEASTIATRWQVESLPPKTPIKVELYANISRRRDLDNLIKPTLDMLQFAGIIQDDRHIDKIRMARVDDIDKDTMLLAVHLI